MYQDAVWIWQGYSHLSLTSRSNLQAIMTLFEIRMNDKRAIPEKINRVINELDELLEAQQQSALQDNPQSASLMLK